MASQAVMNNTWSIYIWGEIKKRDLKTQTAARAIFITLCRSSGPTDEQIVDFERTKDVESSACCMSREAGRLLGKANFRSMTRQGLHSGGDTSCL